MWQSLEIIKLETAHFLPTFRNTHNLERRNVFLSGNEWLLLHLGIAMILKRQSPLFFKSVPCSSIEDKCGITPNLSPYLKPWSHSLRNWVGGRIFKISIFSPQGGDWFCHFLFNGSCFKQNKMIAVSDKTTFTKGLKTTINGFINVNTYFTNVL